MKTKTRKTTNPDDYADELMSEWFGPEYGAGIKKKRKNNGHATRKR